MGVLLTIAFLVSLAAPALAAPAQFGRQAPFETRNAPGYYIWEEGDRWHVRTVNGGTQRLFTGMIETEGTFSEVAVKESEKITRLAVNVQSDKIEFHFNTQAANDGFSFLLSRGRRMKVTLFVDGLPAEPEMIYLEPKGRHPQRHTFNLGAGDRDNGRDDDWGKNRGPFQGRLALNAADLQGKPTALVPGEVLGGFIWQEQDRWYLQTSTTGPERQFTGTIESDGKITDVKKLRSGRKDGAVVETGDNKIKFTFKTGGSKSGFLLDFDEGLRLNQPDKVSGLSFLVPEGRQLKISLSMDGNPLEPANIYLGSGNRHPQDNDLTIRLRNP